MAKLEPLGYEDNEACMALVDGKWRYAVVMSRKGSTVYSLMFPDERVMETGEDKFRDVPLKLMSRAQVFVCGHCGNWIDPRRLPELSSIDGTKAEVVLGVEPYCHHGSLPWTMTRTPWREVEGCSAIGGIHAV
jgi:hypothetical protein